MEENKDLITFKERIRASNLKHMGFWEKLNLNPRTWKKRLDDPSKLTIEETAIIADMLNIPPDQLLLLILEEVKNRKIDS